jgi:Domain of unknown function DUF29
MPEAWRFSEERAQMTDRATLHQLIEDLPESGLLSAERFLAYLRQKEAEKTLARLAHEKLPYDSDFYQWTQTQATALLDKDFAALDLENLAEEIEALGKSDRRALQNHLKVVLHHLLKWAYQPQERERREPGWQDSIEESRTHIELILQDSPSLRPTLPQASTWAYPRARCKAQRETRLPLSTFPETCPWALGQVLDEDFFGLEG